MRGLLFTDLEASTAHLRALGDRYADALARHHELLRQAVADEGGEVVGSEGDSVAAVFPSALAAARAAVAAQRALHAEPWPDGPWRVRMAVHAGTVDVGPGGATGLALHHAARVRNIGHGGQVLLTEPARLEVIGHLPEGVTTKDLGHHDVRDIDERIRLHQLVVDGLPATFPVLRAASPRAVPKAATSFVGRKDEIDSLLELLGEASVVTIVGPGGCGKTRLALAVAERVAGEVCVVELASLQAAQQVAAAVAAGAGTRDPAALVPTIGDRDLLLVLDNCEHVIDAAAEIVAEIAARAPRAKVLATSREPLGIGAERTWTVPRLDRASARALFEERAPRPVDDVDAVDAVCARLDGIPLAIELAAARLRSMPLPELARRLDDQLRVLTGGRRDVARQHTMRATLDWSHDLLDDDERMLLRRLAVFAGGFTLGAAERVTGLDVLEPLDSLVARSLVESDGPSGRYRLLEPVRQYARERLDEAAEADPVSDAHLTWVVQLAADGGRRLFSEQRLIVAALDAEAANIEAALGRAFERGELDRAARIVASLGFYWFTSRRAGTSLWIDRLIERVDELTDADAARALTGAGIVLCDHADDPRPVAWLRRAVGLYRAAGNEPALATALFWLGRGLAVRGDMAGAQTRTPRRRSGSSSRATSSAWGGRADGSGCSPAPTATSPGPRRSSSTCSPSANAKVSRTSSPPPAPSSASSPTSTAMQTAPLTSSIVPSSSSVTSTTAGRSRCTSACGRCCRRTSPQQPRTHATRCGCSRSCDRTPTRAWCCSGPPRCCTTPVAGGTPPCSSAPGPPAVSC